MGIITSRLTERHVTVKKKPAGVGNFGHNLWTHLVSPMVSPVLFGGCAIKNTLAKLRNCRVRYEEFYKVTLLVTNFEG
jgi:hypothetical protein